MQDKKISEAYPQMMGELLFQKRKDENETHFCILSKEQQKKIYNPDAIWRVRIHKEKLIPEFLLLWVYYGRILGH